MRGLLVILAAAGLSLLGASPWVMRAGRFLQLAQLSASGLLMFLLGVAVGPQALHFLWTQDVAAAQPLAALGLGVAGVLLGLNLPIAILRQVPWRVHAAGLQQALVGFLVVAVPVAVALRVGTPLTASGAIGAAALLGAAASVSSTQLAFLWQRSGRLERWRGASLALLAALDDGYGLWVLAIALAAGGATLKAGVLSVGIAVAVGLCCGALTAFLLRGAEGAEYSAILLGTIALVAGAAAYLHVSMLIAGFVSGAVLSTVGGKAVNRAFFAINRVERPVYLLLLFYCGALVDARQPTVWALIGPFVALRFLAKLWAGRWAKRTTLGALALPPEPGYALLGQGGASFCILLDYLFSVGGSGASLAFDVGALAAVINEIIAVRYFPRASEERKPTLATEAA